MICRDQHCGDTFVQLKSLLNACNSKVSNVLGFLQLVLAVSIFQLLCVAEFPLQDADQTFQTLCRNGSREWSCK